MKRVLLCAALAVALAGACPVPADGHELRVRSVRPRNSVTQALVGRLVRSEDLETARRSFDPRPGARIAASLTVAYFERCEGGEADLVFRSFRFRVPYPLGLTPMAELARAGVDWRHDWRRGRLSASYLASVSSQRRLRQTGSFTIRGDRVESRITAGYRGVSARVVGIGPAVWSRPLMPAELRDLPEFRTQMTGALASAESLLRIEQYARDPAFGRIARGLEALDSACLPPAFKRRLRSARRETGGKQYGLVDALLAIEVAPGCETVALRVLHGEFARIDREAAARRAAGEMSELRELVDRVLYRTPLIAVHPVAAVASPPGVGVGVRVLLLDWIEATAGYSWRVRRRPGESTGTPFVEVRFRDPLR